MGEVTPFANARTPAQWAEYVAAPFRKSVESMIETGRRLVEAQQSLGYGEHAAFYDALPFSEATAKKLQLIANDPRIRSHVNDLPPSYGTTYELTKVDDDTFALAVSDGRINPDMTREQAIALHRLEDHQRINASNSNEWYTPLEFIEAARKTMGSIDLDPATCDEANERVKAECIFTMKDNGLLQRWHGNVWMNPPYGKTSGESNQAVWTRKVIDEYAAGNVEQACVLVNAVPGNAWFAPLWDHTICFISRRIRFHAPNGGELGQPTHSNVIVYLGKRIKAFARAYRDLGVTVQRLI